MRLKHREVKTAKKIHVRELRNELLKDFEAQSQSKFYFETSDLLFTAGMAESHACAGLAFVVLAYSEDLIDFKNLEIDREDIERARQMLLQFLEEFENSARRGTDRRCNEKVRNVESRIRISDSPPHQQRS